MGILSIELGARTSKRMQIDESGDVSVSRRRLYTRARVARCSRTFATVHSDAHAALVFSCVCDSSGGGICPGRSASY